MEQSGKNYISLKEAEKITGYSANYLGLRARQGKLRAIKIGRDWFTTQEWLKEYVKRVEEYKAKRKNQTQKSKPEKETLSQPSVAQQSPVQLFLPRPTALLLSLVALLSVLAITLVMANPSPFLSSLKFTFTPFSHSLSSLKDELQPSSFSFLLSSLKSSFDPSSSFSTFLEDTKYLTQKETNYLSLSNFSSLLSPSKPIKKGEIKDYFSFIGQFLKSKANTLLSLIWPEKFLKEEQLKPSSLFSFVFNV